MRKVLLTLLMVLMLGSPGMAVTYMSIADILRDNPSGTFTVGCELTIAARVDDHLFATDGTDYILISRNDSYYSGIKAGDIIRAGWDTQYRLYNYYPRLSPSVSLTSTSTTDFTPEVWDGKSTTSMNHVYSLPGAIVTNKSSIYYRGVELSPYVPYGIDFDITPGVYDLTLAISPQSGREKSLAAAKFVSGLEQNGFSYTMQDANSLRITSTTYSNCPVTIPSSVNFGGIEYPVVAIGDEVFRLKMIPEVTIPESITTIGNYSFYGCGLESLVIPSSVSSFGTDCFASNTYLKSVQFPDNLTYIWIRMFKNCQSLKSITLPPSIITIGPEAFAGCDGLTSITLPSSVKFISSKAFAYCQNLGSVTFPDELKDIDDQAFMYCSALESVTLPQALQSIGEGAFSICTNLSGSITIPSSVTTLNKNAFADTKIQDVIIADSENQLESNGNWLGDTQLSSLYIGRPCSFLPAISKLTIGGHGTENTFSSIAETLTDITINDGVTMLGVDLFKDCTLLSNVSLPASLRTIRGGSFENCTSLTSLIIPDGVTEIFSETFKGCTALEQVNLPQELTTLYAYAFTGCTALKTISIPAKCTAINANTFDGCSSLQSVSMNEGIETIDAEAFADCVSLNDIVLPSALTSIGSAAFYNTALSSISIPATVTSIGDRAFSYCPALTSMTFENGDSPITLGDITGLNSSVSLAPTTLTTLHMGRDWTVKSSYVKDKSIFPNVSSLTLGETLTYLPDYAFDGCDITSLTIPASVNSIGINAIPSGYQKQYQTLRFEDSENELTLLTKYSNNSYNLYATDLYYGRNVSNVNFNNVETLEISDKVTALTPQFSGSITSLTIPASVLSMEYSAFYGCENLTSVTFEDSETEIALQRFIPVNNVVSLYMGRNWTGFAGIFANVESVSFSPYVTAIPDEAFKDNKKLHEVSFSTGLTSVGASSFNGCTALTTANLPEGVTTIGESAFSNCSQLASAVLPVSLTSIGASAFNGCGALSAINLPDKLESLGEYAFFGCSSLASVTLPARLYTIPAYAFYGCSALTAVSIPANVWKIESNAFRNCDFTSFTIEDDPTDSGAYSLTIDESAFDLSNSVTNLYIGRDWSSTKSLGGTTFWPNVENLTLGSHVTTIPEESFKNCNKLASLTIPATVKTIQKNAFNSCSALANMTIEDSDNLLTIGDEALSGTTIGRNVYIGRNWAGSIGAVGNVSIGTSVTSIPQRAFSESNLSAITFTSPSAVAFIGNYAFYKCSKLEELTIPASVNYIEERALEQSAIKSLTFEDNESPIELNNIFDSYWHKPQLTSLYMGRDWFGNESTFSFSSLASVTLGENVTAIPADAFKNSAITEIDIPSSVLLIDSNAFAATQLAQVSIPSSVVAIGSSAFESTPLTQISIPSSVTSIGNGAFKSTQLTEVSIPSSVFSIGNEAFYDSPLATLRLEDSSDVIFLDGNISNQVKNLYLGRNWNGLGWPESVESVTLGSNVTQLPDDAFSDCNKLYSIASKATVPPAAKNNAFGPNLFAGIVDNSAVQVYKSTPVWCKLWYGGASEPTATTLENSGKVYLILSENTAALMKSDDNSIINRVNLEGKIRQVVAIGPDAFSGLEFSHINLPEQIKYVGARAFKNCTNLSEIALPDDIPFVAPSTFSGCTNLSSVSIPASVDAIYSEAFNSCKNLTSVTLPDNVKIIDNHAFYNATALRSVKFGNKLDSIGTGAFKECVNLKAALLPSTVAAIGVEAFLNCSSLEEVSLNGPLSMIAASTFNGCKQLAQINIPATVKSIGTSAFRDCSALSEIVIPASVSSIDDYAFRNASSLSKFSVSDSDDSISFGTDALYLAPIKTLYMGRNWTSDEAISSGINKVTLSSEVTEIPAKAFQNCNGLSTIHLPWSIEQIGDYAFDGCLGLRTVECVSGTPVEANENIFGDATYANATLYVPLDCKSSYEMTMPWYRFNSIDEKQFEDQTGVNGIIGNDNEIADDVMINAYDLNGVKVYEGLRGDMTGLIPGVYIIKGAGKTQKVLIK